MKNVKKLLLVLCLLVMLAGCMNKKQESLLDTITKDGQNYMKEKYGKRFDVVSSKFEDKTVSGLGSIGYDESKAYIYLNDDILVYYDNGKYYDNYQENDIKNAIINEIWNPILEKHDGVYFDKTPIFFGKNMTNGKIGYHNYYDGNINKFVLDEKINAGIATIFIISENGNDWQDKMNQITFDLDSFFDNTGIVMIALTNDLYQQKLDSYNVGMDGCFAERNSNGLIVKQYIDIGEGIHATSNTENLRLEEGDIKLVKSNITVDELQKTMDDELAKYIKKNKTSSYNKYTVDSVSPIYEIVLSDKIKSFNKSFIELYLKFDDESLGISDDYTLIIYDSKDGYSYTKHSNNGQYSLVLRSDKHYLWKGKYISEYIRK